MENPVTILLEQNGTTATFLDMRGRVLDNGEFKDRTDVTIYDKSDHMSQSKNYIKVPTF